MASAVAASSSSLRDPSTTLAPRAASSPAVAAPIPRPAPVIATTFPASCLLSAPVTEASLALHSDRPSSTLSGRLQTRYNDRSWRIWRVSDTTWRSAAAVLIDKHLGQQGLPSTGSLTLAQSA